MYFRFGISVVALVFALSITTWAQVVLETTDPSGNPVSSQIYKKIDGDLVLLGSSGDQLDVQLPTDLILAAPGFVNLLLIVEEGADKIALVPEIHRVKLLVEQPGTNFHIGEKIPPANEKGLLEFDSIQYLEPAGKFQTLGTVYRLPASVDAELRKDGYSPLPVELSPEFWVSKTYPLDEPWSLNPAAGFSPAITRLKQWTELNPVPSAVGLIISLLGTALLIPLLSRNWKRIQMARALEPLKLDGSDPMQGREVGAFRLGRKLGEGGMAAVYIAYPKDSLAADKAVAIKLIHDRVAEDDDFRARFFREVKSIGALTHKNIVEFIDWGEQDGKFYLVMELVEGECLKTKLKSLIPLKEGLVYLIGIARALAYSHAQGVIHRDIKPGNVMISKHGEVKVMDFGLAREHDATTITATGAILGTPAYLPPEQANAEKTIEPAADQYSFGASAYQILTGSLPFQSDDPISVMFMHVTKVPEPLTAVRPEIPPDLNALVLKTLAKSPQDRYPSMQDVLNELESIVNALDTE